MKKKRNVIVGLAIMILIFNCGMAFGIETDNKKGNIMTYIYNGPESNLDIRYNYQWEILRTALEKTKVKFGQYEMKPSKPMTEPRQTVELMEASGKLSVMYLDANPELEKKLIAIHIPVDKNLVGYRIFLINREDKDKYKNINNIEELKTYTYGQGADWIDVGILKNSGFKVVTGNNYEGLFEMLLNRRFNIFLRGAVEIIDEVEQRKVKMPDLYIEENICIYYPLPMYFWFSKTEEGKRLAERVEMGMNIMIDDGTYDKIFKKYHGEKIKKLNLKNRKIFEIPNPNLGPETPFNNKKLWFDPRTYKL